MQVYLHSRTISSKQAVERIHELISQGMSSGEAITKVAAELRASHTGERIVARFEDEDE